MRDVTSSALLGAQAAVVTKGPTDLLGSVVQGTGDTFSQWAGSDLFKSVGDGVSGGHPAPLVMSVWTSAACEIESEAVMCCGVMRMLLRGFTLVVERGML
eukprot:53024-Rhodomonas_salina.3